MAEQPPTTPGATASSLPEIGPLEGAGLLSEPEIIEQEIKADEDLRKTLSDAPFGAVGTAHTLQPGEVCTTCSRKVPHPRKSDSPTSKTVAYKVPVDEIETHREVLDAAAEHVGAAKTPFWQFKTVTAALAVLLQDEGARGLHG